MAATIDARMPKSVPMEVRASPNIEQDLEVMRRDRRSSCMNLMISYIQDGTLPIDKIRAWKLKYQASRYKLIDGVLYRRGYTLFFYGAWMKKRQTTF